MSVFVIFSKEFGLESFISPTLLRNMREKDLRKALTGHMKKIQSLLEPRQKVRFCGFVWTKAGKYHNISSIL